MNLRFSETAIRTMLVMASILLSLILVEAGLRFSNPAGTFHVGIELPFRTNSQDLAKIFTIDQDFGFRPILSNSLRNAEGTFRNNYPLEKRPGFRRVLFIGDSVTERGKIVASIRHLNGDEHLEYWNAGVESFNAVQVVNYYMRYNHVVKPDHVVFTFHNNDFETTPVAFKDLGGKIVVYAPNIPLRRINPTLFHYSYIYRLILGATMSVPTGREAIVAETELSLRLLADTLRKQGIKLTMLIFPVVKPLDQWNEAERFSRIKSVEIARQLQIQYFDLAEPLQEALSNGIIASDSTQDIWHPSGAFADLIASYLSRQRFSLAP